MKAKVFKKLQKNKILSGTQDQVTKAVKDSIKNFGAKKILKAYMDKKETTSVHTNSIHSFSMRGESRERKVYNNEQRNHSRDVRNTSKGFQNSSKEEQSNSRELRNNSREQRLDNESPIQRVQQKMTLKSK